MAKKHKGVYLHKRNVRSWRVAVRFLLDGELTKTSTTYIPKPYLTDEQNKKAAEQTGVEYIARLTREYYEEKEKKNPTVRQFYEEVYVEKAPLMIAETTFELNCRTIEKLFLVDFGDMKLKDVTKAELQKKIQELVNKENENLEDPVPILPQTVERYVSPFRAVFSLAVKMNVLPSDPFAGGLDYPKMYLPKVKCLEQKDYALLLSLLTQKVQGHGKLLTMVDVIIALGMNAGLRRGEIVALKWRNVKNLSADSLDSCCIEVEASAYKVKGKPQIRGNPKSPCSKRTFKVERLMAEVLLKWKQHCEDYCLGGADDDYVIPGRDRGMVSIYSPTKWVKEYFSKVGISEVGLHSLRHTYAAVLIRANTDLETIRAIMGHEDIRTTQIYLYSFRLQEEGLMDDVDQYNQKLLAKLEGGK